MFGLIKKICIGLLIGLVNGTNRTKCVSSINRNVWFNLPLSIYILMNTVKDFTTTHLQLNKIDVLEVVVLWTIYLIKYVLRIKQKI